MDPLAHTLVGAALAKSGLEKRSRYAAAALVIGANLPDLDGIAYLGGADLGLLFRRGWTHGIPAVLVLPALLAGALTLLDRSSGAGRARFGKLLPLCYLAVASHPSLDWLNNYGMRWLMPFDGRWFYGDAVFIVDPWIWLVLGGAVFTATARGPLMTIGWVLLAGAATALMWSASSDLGLARAMFVSGLCVIALLRVRAAASPQVVERINQGALAIALLYVASLVALSTAAHRYAREELERLGYEVEALMAGPRPITPFTKDVVAATPEGYRHGTLSLWPRISLRLEPDVIRSHGPSSLVARALAQPEVRGFAQWARFPWAEIIEEERSFRVVLRDARYVRRPEDDGFGSAVVHVPRVNGR